MSLLPAIILKTRERWELGEFNDLAALGGGPWLKIDEGTSASEHH